MSIKSNADILLHQTGLLTCLQKYGGVHITGSYYMDTMCWNDLDIYLEADPSAFDIYPMIAEVNALLRPFRFDGFADGGRLFYGLETFAAGERWNIDIWIKDAAGIRRSLEYCDGILHQLRENPEKRAAILSIKAELISMGMYGFDKNKDHHYHSNEIYDAVLNENILTAEELLRRHPA
jgi:hypothetical protein